jgi:hypothetical protein
MLWRFMELAKRPRVGDWAGGRLPQLRPSESTCRI